MKFLVDVNLPKRFNFFNSPDFIHIVDINPLMTDEEIWKYALKTRCVILTKDADFYNLFINSATTPKVIYFQLGNCTLKQLHDYFTANWNNILSHLDDNSMIIALKDKIQVIK